MANGGCGAGFAAGAGVVAGVVAVVVVAGAVAVLMVASVVGGGAVAVCVAAPPHPATATANRTWTILRLLTALTIVHVPERPRSATA
jgi:hypothetical protein